MPEGATPALVVVLLAGLLKLAEGILAATGVTDLTVEGKKDGGAVAAIGGIGVVLAVVLLVLCSRDKCSPAMLIALVGGYAVLQCAVTGYKVYAGGFHVPPQSGDPAEDYAEYTTLLATALSALIGISALVAHGVAPSKSTLVALAVALLLYGAATTSAGALLYKIDAHDGEGNVADRSIEGLTGVQGLVMTAGGAVMIHKVLQM